MTPPRMTVTIHADTDVPREQLREARKQVRKVVKDAQKRAADEFVLPLAKVRAWAPVRDRLVVRSNARGAWLTTSGPREVGRIAGLMEFGGTVATVIRPRAGRAVRTPYGPRAAVLRPRHYEPRGILQMAVRERLAPYEDAVVNAVGDMIASELS